MNIYEDQLDETLKKILKEYGDGVKDTLKDTSEDTAKKASKVTKDKAPTGRRHGKYKKSISHKLIYDDPIQGTLYKVYAKGKEYRLTHLLEHGHATPDGKGRTRAFPHWIEGDKYVAENFEKEFIKKLEGK